MTKPMPERRHDVMIISAGFVDPKPTKHDFVETRECVLPGPDGNAWEFLFKCQETGEIRRYGVEDRKVPSWVAEGN